jgi:4'-phosphopantetheinyl transferase
MCIELWLLKSPKSPRSEHATAWSELLDVSENKRRQKLISDAARTRFAMGHGLVRTALSYGRQVAPQDWQFRRTSKGRPSICGPIDSPPLAFNLSYTDGLIACVVAQIELIGVDIEYISDSYPYADIARRVLSHNEHKTLSELPADSQRARFFEHWTLKEAYLKALGVGLEFEPREIELSLEPPDEIRAKINKKENWCFALYAPEPRYRLAMAYGNSRPLEVNARWVTSPCEDGQRFACNPIFKTLEAG